MVSGSPGDEVEGWRLWTWSSWALMLACDGVAVRQLRGWDCKICIMEAWISPPSCDV